MGVADFAEASVWRQRRRGTLTDEQKNSYRVNGERVGREEVELGFEVWIGEAVDVPVRCSQLERERKEVSPLTDSGRVAR